MTWDAVLILRPGLTPEERAAVLSQMLASIEADLQKGVDGGGTIFTAELTKKGFF